MIDSRGTQEAASRTLTRIWKNTVTAMSAIFDASPKPSITKKMGRSTTLGMG